MSKLPDMEFLQGLSEEPLWNIAQTVRGQMRKLAKRDGKSPEVKLLRDFLSELDEIYFDKLFTDDDMD